MTATGTAVASTYTIIPPIGVTGRTGVGMSGSTPISSERLGIQVRLFIGTIILASIMPESFTMWTIPGGIVGLTFARANTAEALESLAKANGGVVKKIARRQRHRILERKRGGLRSPIAPWLLKLAQLLRKPTLSHLQRLPLKRPARDRV